MIPSGAVLIVVALCAAGCGAQVVHIEGDAMAPALKNGENAMVTKTFDRLDRGEIIAFRFPREESRSGVKRVIGLPGEQVEMRQGQVFINGRQLDEPYVSAENRSTNDLAPQSIPDAEFFVLGDNRRNSSDSRHWGTVRRDLIWGKLAR